MRSVIQRCRVGAVGSSVMVLVVGLWARDAAAQATTPAPGSASPAPGIECFPACRDGFVCHQGQCISACNPPCAATETCTSAGACVRSTPVLVVPAPPPASTTNAAPVVYPSAPTAGEPWSTSGSSDTSSRDAADREALPHTRAGGEIGIFAGSLTRPSISGFEPDETLLDAILVITSAKARVRAGSLLVDAELPVVTGGFFNAASVFEASEVSVQAVGNPSAGVSGLIPLRDGRGWISIGAALTLPLASVNRDGFTRTDADLAESLALSIAAGMRGWWDVWKFLPDALALVLPVAAELATERARIGLEGAAATLNPVRDAEGDSVQVLQLGAYVDFLASDVVKLGVRLRSVTLFTGEDAAGADESQFSIEPTIDLTFGHGYFNGGILINLDEPNGLASETMSIWSLRAGGGFHY